MKRHVTTLLLSTLMMLIMAITALAAGWQNDATGWWYDNGDGTYKANEWFTDANGKAYYFDSSGYMMTNAYTPDGYWVGPDGVWVPGQTAHVQTQVVQQTVTRNSGSGASVPGNTEGGTQYVLNTNTMKFHYPNCSSAADIKSGNRAERTTTREALIGAGYAPCGKCHP